jgi:hypothetical protein
MPCRAMPRNEHGGQSSPRPRENDTTRHANRMDIFGLKPLYSAVSFSSKCWGYDGTGKVVSVTYSILTFCFQARSGVTLQFADRGANGWQTINAQSFISQFCNLFVPYGVSNPPQEIMRSGFQHLEGWTPGFDGGSEFPRVVRFYFYVQMYCTLDSSLGVLSFQTASIDPSSAASVNFPFKVTVVKWRTESRCLHRLNLLYFVLRKHLTESILTTLTFRGRRC